MRRSCLSAIVLAAGLAVSASTALAAPLAPVFTYQGEIQRAGAPYTGTADVRFTLFDDAVAGAQVGATQTVNNVNVSNGVFTVNLDFGGAAWATGEARYMLIEVRTPSGGGAFTALSPRQPVTATPYAINALSGAAPFLVKPQGSSAQVLIAPNSFNQVQQFNSAGANVGGLGLNGTGSLLRMQNGTGSSTVLAGTSGDESGFIEQYTDTGAMAILFEAESPAYGQAGYMRLAGTATGTSGGVIEVTDNDFVTTLVAKGGTSGQGATFSLFDPTDGTESLRMFGETAVPGGSIYTFDENGSTEWVLEPDFSGNGAFMLLNNPDGGVLYMESDLAGDPAISLFGSASSFFVGGASTGNDAVQLTGNAVSSAEMLNEPGIANVQGGFIAIPTSPSSVMSRSITVPAAGFVVALLDGDTGASHVAGSGNSSVSWYIDDVAGGTGSGEDDMLWFLPSASPTGTYDFATSSHAVFAVPGPGTYTYHVNMDRSANLVTAFLFDGQFTLMYFPTAYGTTDPSLTGPTMRGTPTGNSGMAIRGPQTPAEIAAERAQSQGSNMARVQAEMAAMRAEMAELRAMMANNPNIKAMNAKDAPKATKAPAGAPESNSVPVADAGEVDAPAGGQ